MEPFVDVTAQSGIHFQPGLPPGQLNIRDIAGSGCGFVDFDRDGKLDAILLGRDHCALYHNAGGGKFKEFPDAGLPQKGQWIGCASADYDSDGFPDLLLTGYGCLALLHNEAGHRFRDVTAAVGLQQREPYLFATGASWGDYDGDGWLDLYVTRYVYFKDGMTEQCRSRAGFMETCNPDHYAAQKGSLYRSVGGKRFQDATAATGADNVHGKGWGVLFFDYDGDGKPDLYIANDELAGDLLHNEGERFRNLGTDAGVAYDADGKSHGAMGADCGDYDRDGRLDLAVTTFSNEAFSVYRNNGDGSFTDRAAPAGIAIPTGPMVGWATRFLDYDRDGWPDLLFINGHATDSERYHLDRSLLRQPPQLFHNAGGFFQPASLSALSPMVGRGAAFGDYDEDGDEDALVMDIGGEAHLLRGTAAENGTGHWLGISLAGRAPNLQALGAQVTVRTASGKQLAEVRTSGGLYAANDPRLLFGLGSEISAQSVEVRWPGGKTTRVENVAGGRYVSIPQP
jgi:hypothetical protein